MTMSLFGFGFARVAVGNVLRPRANRQPLKDEMKAADVIADSAVPAVVCSISRCQTAFSNNNLTVNLVHL